MRRFRLPRLLAASTALAVLGVAGVLALACGGDTGTNPDVDFDADVKPRDGGSVDVVVADTTPIDPPDAGPSCTAKPCVRSLAVGGEFACAILDEDSSVWCWGANVRGQSGVGSSGGGIAPGPIRAPKKVAGLGPAKQLALGFFHACALATDETVSCWGHDLAGQLGNTAGKDDVVPRAVKGIPTAVKEIVAGGYHTCARLAGGEIMCWGDNSEGQLGLGSRDAGSLVPSSTPTPTTVPTLDKTVALGAGDRFTCALLRDAGVSCFGDDTSGKLGRGTSGGPHPEAAPVTGLLGPVAYLAHSGGYAEHVVLADGRLQGWGENTNGEIGLGTTGASALKAALIPNVSNVSEVAPGSLFTCALHTDGTVECWGRNDHGQTGLPPEAGTPQPVPKTVRGITNAVHIAAGLRDFACALLTGGSVVCWGSNSDGQLGRGSNIAYDPAPAPVQF